MLFSDRRIVQALKSSFVCAWQSVAPVPKVTIDFGNGRQVSRTVNGNIAFYFCTPSGQVVHVVPGILTPEAFLEQMRIGLLLARGTGYAGVEYVVKSYHSVALEGAVEVNKAPGPPIAKAAVERSVHLAFRRKGDPAAPAPVDPSDWTDNPAFRDGGAGFRESSTAFNHSPEERSLLEADTALNLRDLMPKVHAMLLETPVTTPRDLCKRLYREVLHCDLDDPYLGLLPNVFNHGAVNR
ncbi:MAG: hypothetical protein HYZ53_18100 [Planctomycetes bacterium]|nr:hypothetical protein [Planctomycetota bacterium]